ncbi:hypothetical protein LWI28_007662 [Acer negundo]|uniref:Uncharacterized protein n=1 Tax=Acer negundo TaxID=4023 RepID=A0AAD5NRK4_ACENE|nr:hypothetical protein LWI28_007662 [Acer negundo]
MTACSRLTVENMGGMVSVPIEMVRRAVEVIRIRLWVMGWLEEKMARSYQGLTHRWSPDMVKKTHVEKQLGYFSEMGGRDGANMVVVSNSDEIIDIGKETNKENGVSSLVKTKKRKGKKRKWKKSH